MGCYDLCGGSIGSRGYAGTVYNDLLSWPQGLSLRILFYIVIVVVNGASAAPFLLSVDRKIPGINFQKIRLVRLCQEASFVAF